MDKKVQNIDPDYRRIYSDIIAMKFPEKRDKCENILQKKNLSVLDILELNRKVFGTANKETESFNQRHRSYDEAAIRQILEYQKKYYLNNSQLSLHFKVSRNSVAKWRKLFY